MRPVAVAQIRLWLIASCRQLSFLLIRSVNFRCYLIGADGRISGLALSHAAAGQWQLNLRKDRCLVLLLTCTSGPISGLDLTR